MSDEGPMDDALSDVVKAAANFALVVGAKYRDERPEDYGAFKTLFDAGRVEVRVTIDISPTPSARLIFVDEQGVEHPVCQCDAKHVSTTRLN